eukprot:3083478-Pleurochrysis_carterae.AAC.1
MHGFLTFGSSLCAQPQRALVALFRATRRLRGSLALSRETAVVARGDGRVCVAALAVVPHLSRAAPTGHARGRADALPTLTRRPVTHREVRTAATDCHWRGGCRYRRRVPLCELSSSNARLAH